MARVAAIPYRELLRRGCRRPIEPQEVVHLERLGALLRELRKAAGLTQDELARLSQLSRFMIHSIENGGRRTRRSTLARIAAALSAVHPAHGNPEKLTDKLVTAAGPALAEESPYADIIARRRRRRARRGRYSLTQPGLCPVCGTDPRAAAGV